MEKPTIDLNFPIYSSAGTEKTNFSLSKLAYDELFKLFEIGSYYDSISLPSIEQIQTGMDIPVLQSIVRKEVEKMPLKEVQTLPSIQDACRPSSLE